jgi:hypothetical protein
VSAKGVELAEEELFCGPGLLAAGVLAIATYFHHVRFLGLFAVFAAILAALFGRAIARRVRALIFRLLSHKNFPAFW